MVRVGEEEALAEGVGRLVRERSDLAALGHASQAGLDAVRGGVPKAAIIDGREPHSVLIEIFTARGIGTEVTP